MDLEVSTLAFQTNHVSMDKGAIVWVKLDKVQLDELFPCSELGTGA